MGYTEAELLQFIDQKTDVKNYFKSYLSDVINKIRSPGCTYLTHAVKKGSFETINYFIKEKGGNVNLRETTGGTPLLIAVYLNRLEVVECLIDNGANINGVDSFGRTPLIVAVRERNLDIIEFLIDHAADLKPVDMKMFSALLWAIKMDDAQIVDLFMRKKANHLENARLLTFAAEHGSINVVEFLLKQEVNVNDSFEGKTPLGWAAASGHLNIIKMLVSKGANVNQLDSDGNTSLAVAAQYKQSEVVKYLTETSNVCKVGTKGKTPLFWAVQNEDADMVQWLLDHGAVYIVDTVFLDAIELKNLNIVRLLKERGALINPVKQVETSNTSSRITPLMKSLEVGSSEIARYLIENGADVAENFGNATERTPLFLAVSNQDFDIVKMILDHQIENISDSVFLKAIETKNSKIVKLLKEKGALISTGNKNMENNETPLMKALEVQSIEIAKYLIENGAKIVEELKENETSYIINFLENRNFQIVKLLTENGARLNVSSDGGNTVLIKAIQIEDFEMVKYFLEHHADVNQPNKNQQTPLTAAATNNDFRIFQYLIDSGAKLPSNEKDQVISQNLARYYQLAKQQSLEAENRRFEASSNQEDGKEDI